MHLDNFFFIKRCSIFYIHDFEFENSESRNKYFLTLNCQYGDEDITFVLPTSQVDKYYYQNPINMRDVLVIEKGESKFFHKKTYIDLKNIDELSFEQLEEKYQQGDLVVEGTIEDVLLTKIENIIKNSELINKLDKDYYLCN